MDLSFVDFINGADPSAQKLLDHVSKWVGHSIDAVDILSTVSGTASHGVGHARHHNPAAAITATAATAANARAGKARSCDPYLPRGRRGLRALVIPGVHRRGVLPRAARGASPGECAGRKRRRRRRRRRRWRRWHLLQPGRGRQRRGEWREQRGAEAGEERQPQRGRHERQHLLERAAGPS